MIPAGLKIRPGPLRESAAGRADRGMQMATIAELHFGRGWRKIVEEPALADFADDIDEALYDAVCDGEGRANAKYLCRHLATRGLVIVSAQKYDALLTSLQLIASCGSEVARAALKRVEA